LAADEALLTCAETGKSGEVLRVWAPEEVFVVVGFANRVGAEVNAQSCRVRGIPILRRISGGGTVVQGPGCLNYTLILSLDQRPELATIPETNRRVLERQRQALGPLLGRALSLEGHTDLAVDGSKCSGNAQRRHARWVLFHGTFLLQFDVDWVTALLPMPSRQPSYRRNRDHLEFLTNLDLPAEVVKAALRRIWHAGEDFGPPPQELTDALVRDKYSTEAWNWRLP
jgi:lipoate-protein ligase A